ncbi:FAD-dependent oxidoreductase [Sphaerisporangium corydalis]|uniref:FAD-dependent oxidoreductase n=1 Tax=Sphaerisporangium corydalis TaxID=1441875 RepID=A0ABV9EH99_9ACTN|nr:FAD-dependent oxidoreductase [Sphaerisporangium corydalis]
MAFEETDVVVIGSGMGGLAAARMLAQFGGARVLVLEQHYTLGGMTHEFSREDRYRFGTGVHYISANAGPFLNFMTDGRVQLQPLPDDYDVLHFPGFDFAVPATLARFRARLAERFPGEAEAIDRYFRKARRAMAGLAARNVLSSLPAPLRGVGYPIVERLFPATYRPLRDEVHRSVTDPRLRAILQARWGLYGTPPARSAFGYHAAVPTTFFMDGTAHPVGGPKAISEVVLEILGEHGVELRTRQLVERIVVERGRVAGVDVRDTGSGRAYRVKAPTVVSAAGVRNTYALLGRSAEVADLPAEPSAVMLFLGLERSPAAFGLRGENHWFMPDLDGSPHGTLYVSFASLNNPAARFHTVEVLELVDPATFDQWRDRPEEYRKLKEEWTERLLDRLEERWPGLRETVAFAELATPLTFENYQHSVRGSFYGLAATPQRLRSRLAGTRTPVKGLVVAGQDAWGSGVVGALAGGVMAANAVLPPRRVGAMWRAVRGPIAPRPGEWRGYLRVSGVEPLTPSISRIRLVPLGAGATPFGFVAGQYLKIELPVAVEPIERSYSISSGPDVTDFVEIAVKREPDGLGSTFLHDELRVGQALRVSGPFGEFTWVPAGGGGTLLLIAGGVGITPLMSVLSAAASAGHRGRVVLLVGCRDEPPFQRELDELRAILPGLEVVVFRTGPGGRGRIDLDALRPYAAGVDRVHLCGPEPMMRDVLGHLARLGVPRDIVRTEAFVSARSGRTRRERAHAIAVAAQEAGVTGYTIGTPSGHSFPCPPGRTVLDAANAARVPFPQSCGEGVCGTCRVRVIEGTYETDARGMFSTEELDQGWRLACQTLPTGDLVIDR